MKRIIICADGTWNRPGIMDRKQRVMSNVEILYNCIPERDDKGTRQVKCYETGVGSSTFDRRDQIEGGVSGRGLDTKIMDVYRFLIMNYEPGDDIYLFGFSRGAYTVRSLAGFIHNCGILRPEYIMLVDQAFDLYRNRNDYTHPESDTMRAFKENYCSGLEAPIHFIGVWDTVGSLGLPFRTSKLRNFEQYKFHDTKLSHIIRNAFHALAIDERRKPFAPALWEQTQKGAEKGQQIEQRWFCGVHCNIGGGYADTGLSDLSLNWMSEKAKACGLQINGISTADGINQTRYKFNPNARGELRNSMTMLYWITGKHVRKLLQKGGYNETIDDSVYERVKNKPPKYDPKNLPKGTSAVAEN